MDSPAQLRWILSSLKRALKARKITYAALAKELGITESGVKKIFGARDCSFGRLEQICRVAGVSLGDLLQAEDGSDVEDVSFSREQQEYFLGHMDCFYFFWKLAFERRTLEEIRKEDGLSAAEAQRYLRKLDGLKLVRRELGDRLRLPRLKRVRSFGDGPLMRKIYRDWSIEFMKEIATPEERPGRQFIIRYFRMKESTYAELLSELRRVEMEFLKRAIREMSLDPARLIHVRWVSAADRKSFVGSGREAPAKSRLQVK